MYDDDLYDGFRCRRHELLLICDELPDLIGLCDAPRIKYYVLCITPRSKGTLPQIVR